MIPSEELTFIVQGQVSKEMTPLTLESVRKHFPNSQIILSTWEGTSVDHLNVDQVIFNTDPGSLLRDDVNRIYHNANRQIITTISGLKASKSKYSVKIRSDVIFLNSNLLQLLEVAKSFNKYDLEWRFVQGRVIVTNITSVNPRKIEEIPFHPCDWIYAGLTKDLINIWDIQLFDEQLMTRWYETHQKPKNFPFENSLALMNPENFIWSSFVKKYKPIKYEHLSDVSGTNIEDSEKSFANNLIVYSYKQLGMYSLKHVFKRAQLYKMYTYSDWKNLYYKYSDPKVRFYTSCDSLLNLLSYYTKDVRYFFHRCKMLLISGFRKISCILRVGK